MTKSCLKLTGIAFLLFSAMFGGSNAQSSFNSFPNIGKENDEPIQIEALELEVLDEESKAVFSGDVVVVQGGSTLKSDLLTVHYDGNGTEQQNISKIEASGGVVITSEDQSASGDEAVFDTILSTLVMTGERVVLSQSKNVVVGNRLSVELETGKAKMVASEGERIKVLLDSQLPASSP